MAKDKQEPPVVDERKERVCMGCKLNTWFKLVNMILGGLMILLSVVSFFSINVGN